MLRFALLLIALIGAACADPEDEVCTPDTVPADKDDDCPFGEKGGPKVTEAQCVNELRLGAPSCADIGWIDDVYPALTKNAPKEADCASSACHGRADGVVGGITLDPKDAASAFTVLKTYTGVQKFAYLDTAHPESAWITCNLAAQDGGDVPMPPSGVDSATYDLVAKWVACGLPLGD